MTYPDLAKIKVDGQIVAIGKVAGARAIYTDDRSLGNLAARVGLMVVKLHQLPLPPAEDAVRTIDMFAEPASAEDEGLFDAEFEQETDRDAAGPTASV